MKISNLLIIYLVNGVITGIMIAIYYLLLNLFTILKDPNSGGLGSIFLVFYGTLGYTILFILLYPLVYYYFLINLEYNDPTISALILIAIIINIVLSYKLISNFDFNS